MKAVRCPNGHWYDSESYDKCPHCGQSSSVVKNRSNDIQKQSKKSFSLFKKGKKTKDNITSKETQNKSVVTDEVKMTTSVTHDEVTERFFADIDDDKTVGMFEADDVLGDKVITTEKEDVSGEMFPTQKSTSEPLATVVQRVSAMDEGKTLSYFNAMTAQKDSSTEHVEISKTTDPVVGWLVAISGVHFGESFQLYVGKNTIGRNGNNKVVLGLDKSISRENHATIIYEPKRKEFYLQSGNSDGLIYLNDSFVNSSQLIKERDTLEIGASKLIFVPLCGTEFSWEQYI